MTEEKIKLAKIKLKKSRKKRKNKVTIEPIEKYINDYNLKAPKPDISKFPDLFKVKLDKKQNDDIQSKVSVLEGTPAINLYTALLVATNDLPPLRLETNKPNK